MHAYYLGEGAISDSNCKTGTSSIWLMPGLSASVFEMHDNAISTAFHRQFALNSPCSLGSTTFWISPLSIIGMGHSGMWMALAFWGALSIADWPVITQT